MNYTSSKHIFREKRGALKSFSDLPLCKQVIFNQIAIEINRLHPDCGEAYIFGSHAWGTWNDKSDYDVALFVPDNYIKTRDFLRDKFKLKIDITWFNKDAVMRDKLVKIFSKAT
jgi:predicted nucleotidyltransferase